MKSIDRVTITIKKDILKRVDRLIDGEVIKSRSHAIEQLVQKSLSKAGVDVALIMAGGEGAALRPITYEIPKAMIPIHGRPILEHQIIMLRKNGIENMFLAINKEHEAIRNYFGDGSRLGVRIKYIAEEKPLGTAGALSMMKGRVNASFIMMNVDTLISPDMQEVADFHKKQNTLATIVLVTMSEPKEYGVVKMRGGRVVEFAEKPEHAESNLINAGICVIEPDVINYVSGRTMVKDLFSCLCKENQLSGFVHDGPFFDVGTHEGYEKAIKLWKDVR